MGRPLLRPIPLAAIVLALLPCGPAAAGTVDVVRARDAGAPGVNLESRVVRYVAGAGERNQVGVVELEGRQRGLVRVRDAAGVQAGEGCRRNVADEPTVAVCSFSAPGEGDTDHPNVLIRLGDEGDTLKVHDEGLGTAVFAGAGADSIGGGSQNNFYDLGSGDDEVASSGRRDVVDEGQRRSGADDLRLDGLGAIVSYAERRRGVHVDLDRRADDGEPGERDRVLGLETHDVTAGTQIIGGRGRDWLRGDDEANILLGGGGRDVLTGGPGDDYLAVDGYLAFGQRRVGGSTTADRADGGRGADRVYGNRGPNRLAGGPGRDLVDGGPGNDRLGARDRSPDSVHCGRGVDRVALGALDFFANRRSNRCELTVRTVPAAAVVFGLADPIGETYIGDQRSAFVAVGCPGDALPVCHGVLRLVHRRRELGRVRFRLRRGARREVEVRLSRLGRRRVVRRGDLSNVWAVATSLDRTGSWRTTRVGGLELLYDDGEGPGGPDDY